MRISAGTSPYFSNFYLDGECAFMDGASLDQNPYMAGDDAAAAWQAGWMSACHVATSVVANRPGTQPQD